MICFCTRGTCSSGISRPRSPRATITPCTSPRIATRFSTAAGRSIFATIGTVRPASLMILFARATSSAVCTKLSATKSTPRSRPKRKSAASLSVMHDAGRRTPGALMPLCSPSKPPATTTVLSSAGGCRRRLAAQSFRRRAAGDRRGAPIEAGRRMSSRSARVRQPRRRRRCVSSSPTCNVSGGLRRQGALSGSSGR